MVGGAQSQKNQSHNHWVGDSQSGEQLYYRSPATGVKVLSPMLGFPTWGSGNRRRNSQRIRLWRLVGFDCRTSTELGETKTPLLESTHNVVCTSGPRGNEQWSHRRMNQTLSASVGGSPAEAGAAMAHRGDEDTGSRNSGKYSFVWSLPESAISPTKGTVSSSVGLPQARQPTGREPSPTHQQTIGLKFYWALPSRATPSSTPHQSLPSGSLHKPLR